MKAFLTITLFTLLFGAVSAHAADSGPVRILVSVGDLGNNKDLEWRKDACENIYALGNQIVPQGVQVTCRVDAIHVIDTYLQQLKADNAYHIRLLRGFKGSFRLAITNWNRTLESDFTTLGWNIGREPHTTSLRAQGLRVVLSNFYEFVKDEESLKTQWLIQARLNTGSFSYDLKDLAFKGKDRKVISLDTAARMFEQERPENLEYLRTRQELAVAYTVESAPNLELLGQDNSLVNILQKTAVQSQKVANFWSGIISFDDRGFSETTQSFMTTIARVDKNTVGQDIPAFDIATPAAPAANQKKMAAKLIYLF